MIDLTISFFFNDPLNTISMFWANVFFMGQILVNFAKEVLGKFCQILHNNQNLNIV